MHIKDRHLKGDCSLSELIILVPTSRSFFFFFKIFNDFIFLAGWRTWNAEGRRMVRLAKASFKTFWILERKESVQGAFAAAVALPTDLEGPCISNTCSASSERICSWPLLSAYIVSAFRAHELHFQSALNQFPLSQRYEIATNCSDLLAAFSKQCHYSSFPEFPTEDARRFLSPYVTTVR